MHIIALTLIFIITSVLESRISKALYKYILYVTVGICSFAITQILPELKIISLDLGSLNNIGFGGKLSSMSTLTIQFFFLTSLLLKIVGVEDNKFANINLLKVAFSLLWFLFSDSQVE